MKSTLILTLVILPLVLFVMGCSDFQEHPLKASVLIQHKAKYEPPEGRVLLFVGQDNASVGGNARFENGYIDNVDIPGGITHYVGMGADHSNKFKTSFDGDYVDGLNIESQWGAGPMCMKYYLDSPHLNSCIIHLSIAMTGNNEDKVADGSLDHLIDELVSFLNEYDSTPFLIRIGYEFDGSWNGYDPDNFKKAFRRIVDKLRLAQLSNFATVMASSSFNTPYESCQRYYPGNEYVDWVGYSYWEGNSNDGGSLRFARGNKKPVFIAESTPRGHFLDKEDGQQLWSSWYEPFFQHIEENLDVIRAISYINCHWEAQPMWKGESWGNTRIESNDYIKEKWLLKMQQPRFINAKDQPFEFIGFSPSEN